VGQEVKQEGLDQGSETKREELKIRMRDLHERN
jgi:hypothetical protein